MTRTEAFKAASNAVSIHGSRTSWTIYYPYYDTDLTGPTGSTITGSYWKALARARVIKARIAGALLGIEGDELAELQYRVENGADWRAAVREAVKIRRREFEIGVSLL